MKGKKVLLIDADPQGDLTVSLGWKNSDRTVVTKNMIDIDNMDETSQNSHHLNNKYEK